MPEKKSVLLSGYLFTIVFALYLLVKYLKKEKYKMLILNI